uniref:Putative glycosyl hydrolase n=1 Tax=Phaedon cochleariae TaxID=80249 RepID=A0A0K8TVF8_PHACE
MSIKTAKNQKFMTDRTMTSSSAVLTLLLTFYCSGNTYGEELNNRRFPQDFMFGVATASYQVEGAWNEDGKGVNIWDVATHQVPSPVVNNATGDVACDSYHQYKRDVAILKEIGADFYRFSLSWSRILPSGFDDKVNKAGVKYYKNLIKELRANNITPLVTLFHWDLPQSLQDLGGFQNDIIIDRFVDFARVCFREFGEDVQYWMTFNEPISICHVGYALATLAPQINSPGMGEYLCAHNLMRAHAKAYRMYDEEFRSAQNGLVGIDVNGAWYEPSTNSSEDIEASETLMQFTYGCYAHPIVHGDYPEVMKKNVARRSALQGYTRSRLPEFTPEEIKYMTGTYDYIGVNIYTTELVTPAKGGSISEMGIGPDAQVTSWQPEEWEKSSSSWLKVVPWGARKLLQWLGSNYKGARFIITENGYSDDGRLEDDARLSYYERYLSKIRDAIEFDGVDVFGYTAWSLMDNFEWMRGYSEKFGLYQVDFNSPNRTRTPKKSAKWYANVTRTKCLVETCVE